MQYMNIIIIILSLLLHACHEAFPGTKYIYIVRGFIQHFEKVEIKLPVVW